MEFLVKSVSILILLGLVLFPILLILFLRSHDKKTKFIKYIVIGTFLTVALILIEVWWYQRSFSILLSNYSYDFSALNDADRFFKVLSENMERVKVLETQMYSVGWPVKAFLWFWLYIPYLFIVYGVASLIERTRV